MFVTTLYFGMYFFYALEHPEFFLASMLSTSQLPYSTTSPTSPWSFVSESGEELQIVS